MCRSCHYTVSIAWDFAYREYLLRTTPLSPPPPSAMERDDDETALVVVVLGMEKAVENPTKKSGIIMVRKIFMVVVVFIFVVDSNKTKANASLSFSCSNIIVNCGFWIQRRKSKNLRFKTYSPESFCPLGIN